MGRFRVDSSIIEQQGGRDFATSDSELIVKSEGVDMDNNNAPNREKRNDILSTFHNGMYTLQNLSNFQMLTDQRKTEKPELRGGQNSFYYDHKDSLTTSLENGS